MTTTRQRIPRQRRTSAALPSRVGQLTVAAAAGVLLLGLLVGIPLGLAHWIGWPLPHQWPTPARLKSALTSRFTDRAMLDVLACLCWACWLVFVVDVVRAAPAALHGRSTASVRLSGRVGPVRFAAALLIGTIASGLLGPRPGATQSAQSSTGQQAAEQETADILALPTPRFEPQQTPTVTVREPLDGVHDSLWRIAQRTLGDGNRWPEIYRLNEGRPQPDGLRLASPSMIQPGWILQLPESRPTSSSPAPSRNPTPLPVRPNPVPVPTPSPHPTSPMSATASTAATSPAPTVAPSTTRAPTSEPNHGIDVGDGVYVSLGLAAALSGALVTAQRRRRRSYVPGSGRRNDLQPSAPVIRNLQLAHLRETGGALPIDEDDDAEDHPVHAMTELTDPGPETRPPTPTPTHLDLRNLDLRNLDTGHGLGLVGPGAADAARAVLLDSLTDTAELVIPIDAAVALFGSRDVLDTHPRVHTVDDLDAALDQLDAALLYRARLQSEAEHQPAVATGSIVLITHLPKESARLQAALDIGGPLGLRAIVLGQWRAGSSCHVAADGTLTATSNPAGQPSLGAHVFTVTMGAARDILATLTIQAPSTPPTAEPATPSAKSRGLNGEIPRQPGTATDDTRPGARPKQQETEYRPIDAGPSASSATTSATLLTVFGTPRLNWTSPNGEITDLMTALSKRQRDLTVLLALHPDGLERGRLAETLWPDSPPDRPFNSLHTTLSRLRRNLAAATADRITDLIAIRGDRYLLAPEIGKVDYWTFETALSARRAATTTEDRADACQQVVSCYRGELASGVEADWLDTPREAARRDALDAATELARAVVNGDPHQALSLLEMACEFDPLNEQIYCSIMRVQGRLGRRDSIARTVTLLRTRLAEIGEEPEHETLALAETLRTRQSAHTAQSAIAQ